VAASRELRPEGGSRDVSWRAYNRDIRADRSVDLAWIYRAAGVLQKPSLTWCTQ